MSRKDTSWLGHAVHLANLGTCRQKHGAIVVSGGRLLSVGINRDKNHPLILPQELVKFHASVHAEKAALATLKGLDLRHATLYVARVNRMGLPLLSKPCIRCAQSIRAVGIRKVVWTI